MSRRRTRNQIKGLAERYLECSVPPGAVREDEVQETPLLPWLLPLEQGWCTASEFEKLDALVQVGPVCRLVFLDRSKNPILLGPPLARHAVEEPGVHPSVELVDVHGVYPALEPGVLGLKSPDGFLVELLLVRVALPKGIRHPPDHLVIERQPSEEVCETVRQNLLSRVTFRALPTIACAVVVDVPTLLDFPDERTAAVAAGDEP